MGEKCASAPSHRLAVNPSATLVLKPSSCAWQVRTSSEVPRRLYASRRPRPLPPRLGRLEALDHEKARVDEMRRGGVMISTPRCAAMKDDDPVRMRTYAYVCVRMCTYVYVCVRMCTYVCVRMRTYAYVCVHALQCCKC